MSRVRGSVWRRLNGAGAVYLANSVAALPAAPSAERLHHIELVTGQPAHTVRGFMRRARIPVRDPGGRSPFLRRWRAGTRYGTSARRPVSYG